MSLENSVTIFRIPLALNQFVAGNECKICWSMLECEKKYEDKSTTKIYLGEALIPTCFTRSALNAKTLADMQHDYLFTSGTVRFLTLSNISMT